MVHSADGSAVALAVGQALEPPPVVLDRQYGVVPLAFEPDLGRAGVAVAADVLHGSFDDSQQLMGCPPQHPPRPAVAGHQCGPNSGLALESVQHLEDHVGEPVTCVGSSRRPLRGRRKLFSTSRVEPWRSSISSRVAEPTPLRFGCSISSSIPEGWPTVVVQSRASQRRVSGSPGICEGHRFQ